MDRLAVKGVGAAIGLVEAAENLDQRGFARAVIPHQAEHLAAMQAQADVRQGRDRAEALTQMLGLKDERSCSINHQRFLRTRTASTCTLRIMAAMIAAPR